MISSIIPKLPMRHKPTTQAYYEKLGFKPVGTNAYDFYLMMELNGQEVHFFEFKDLNPAENYGQVYLRSHDIDTIYQQYLSQGVAIHPNGQLVDKPWDQREFALLDPDHNLLTFGMTI